MNRTENATVDVAACDRCGQAHKGVVFRAFQRPALGLTHWAACPTTREPLFAAIAPEVKEESHVVGQASGGEFMGGFEP